MRILALDYGSARCGCAISDPGGVIPRPLETIQNPTSETGMAEIASLAEGLNAERIVVGMPVSLDGVEGGQAAEVRKFVKLLSDHVSVEVHTFDERFTTKLAKKTMKTARRGGAPSSASEDSLAAAHLLAEYINSLEGE